jgi:YhcH/YjgK/YiaL family protein
MALFGPLNVLRTQAPGTNAFAIALAYALEAVRRGSVAHDRILSLTAGSSEKIELVEGVFAIEQVYQTKPRSEGFFESHRKYVDVQVIVEGIEAMEIEDTSRLSIEHPYLEERDLIKYADTTSASRLLVRAGDAAIFFPVDGHMPGLRVAAGSAVLVRKTVVKVPVG